LLQGGLGNTCLNIAETVSDAEYVFLRLSIDLNADTTVWMDDVSQDFFA